MLLHILATGGVDSTAVLSFVAIVLAAAAIVGGSFFAWVNSRRKNSGKIETSEAATLWQQSESMRKDLQESLIRTEAQRDSLINLFQEQMLPSLAALNKNQSMITDSVSEVLTLLRATGPLPGSREEQP